MKNYLYIILTLIFFALVGIGFLIYKTYEVNRAALSDNLNRLVDETSDKVFVTSTEDTVLVESNGEKEPMGTVTGQVCYPSQSIPPLTLYFENSESGESVSLDTELNQDTYEIDLTPGTYTAYANVKGIDESTGGYTEAVPCGLTADCGDHTLIQFKVVDEGLTSDIDMCDWYGVDVPAQETVE